MLLVTGEEMRALDRETIEQIGVPGAVLMESAGRGVVEVISQLVDVEGAGVVVWAGGGNNGGDGFVVARHLANRGAHVVVVLCAPVARVHGDARTHFDAARKTEGVEILDGTSDDAVYEAAASTVDAQVVVDALFGTGLQREVTGHFAGAI